MTLNNFILIIFFFLSVRNSVTAQITIFRTETISACYFDYDQNKFGPWDQPIVSKHTFVYDMENKKIKVYGGSTGVYHVLKHYNENEEDDSENVRTITTVCLDPDGNEVVIRIYYYLDNSSKPELFIVSENVIIKFVFEGFS